MRTSPLTLQHVTRRFGDRTVLDDVSFGVRPGERIGIIGDNGAGKSTLLRLIAGLDAPDAGELTVHAPGGTGHLAQSSDLPPEATVQDAVDEAMAELRALERRIRRAETDLADLADPEGPEGPGGPEGPDGPDGSRQAAALAEYGRLVARYEARAGYTADSRVEAALHGLGLPGLDRARRLGTLSGGERARLALAATLAARAELLLLDEPTNDLDDGALAWLEAHLRAHRGTVLAVTHDRVFLERVTDTVLEVAEGRVRRHGDGYAGHLAARAAERRRRLREYAEWRAELTRHQELAATHVTRLAAIPRKAPLAVFGHGGFRARGRAHGATVRIRNAKERVARLTDRPVLPPPEPLVFAARIGTAERPAAEGPAAGGPPPPAAELDGVLVPGRLALPALRIGPAERLLVTGPNGAGKTTLLRVLAGELRPAAGTVRTRGRVGHLRQHEPPWPPGLTVLRAFAHGRPGDPADHLDRLLSLGLFHRADLGRRIGDLSYGQRRRIELARLVAEPVDLLLLDEPTNHLAPALVEELESALSAYPGAVALVTHDRRLRARFPADQHLALTSREAATNAG
ncbi:TlrC/CarA/OleB/SrmB family ABC-F type ribosomal protection protein [Kitasatospora sp. NPDC088391]|uniref:TlrC/CarA/OleB/SrmB family ABC-F type ribosomal protection protein n=1 Tax=Kitasatospora sp. NPDC088391 TaxID=3364074 RepID=UPI003828FADD